MNSIQILKNCFAKIPFRGTAYGPSVVAQKSFLEKLPSPQDDWERSYLQYKCQTFLQSYIWSILLNCAAAVLFPIYWIRLCSVKLSDQQPCDAILLFSGPRNIVPRSLEEEFRILQIEDFQDHLYLDKEDQVYLRKLHRRYPFSFYFLLKCMLKIAMYRDVISRYQPKAIICSEEYSFTSSVLTDYCLRHQVEHINFQHGVKMYFIREAFFRFDRCYVWDQHSADILRSLRAAPGQFVTERPLSLCFSEQTTTLERVDYTYYLQIPTPQELETIIKNLTILQKRGGKIAVRPHPLHIDLVKSLYKDSSGLLLEDPREVSIEQSLLRTDCAIALSSAALIQAVYNNIPIVIDDITIPGLYDDLTARQYICMKKEHRRLSELLASLE